MMLGPVLAGLLSDIVGLRPLFGFGAVAGGVGTLVFTWLTTEEKAGSRVKRRERVQGNARSRPHGTK